MKKQANIRYGRKFPNILDKSILLLSNIMMLGYNDLPNKESLKFFLGLRIKQLRSKHGLTIKDLSKICGLSASYINEIEKGKKFPKVDKLSQVAKGLNVSINDLLKGESDSNFAPLLGLLEKDVIKDLPLEIFGINKQDVMELMSHSPEKFGSLLKTVADLGRSHNLSLKNFQKTAIKTFKEKNFNYLPEIEKHAKRISKKFQDFSVDNLTNILVTEYKYKITEFDIEKVPDLKDIRSLFKAGKKNKLILNSNLHRTQKAFLLAKEIGYCELKIPLFNRNTHDQSNETFQSIYDDYRTSYFAGALLLDRDNLKDDLENWFKETEFDQTYCFKLIRKYDVSIELFFHRMTQILPECFGFNDLFFLQYEKDAKGNINPKDGLHFSKLHFPHGIGPHETYCKRWITISAIEELEKTKKTKKFGMQISQNINGEKYLCLTMARRSNRKEDTTVSLTIGITIDKKIESKVKFLSDKKIPFKEVGHTCERCPIQNCKERAEEPIIYQLELLQKNRKDQIKLLLNE